MTIVFLWRNWDFYVVKNVISQILTMESIISFVSSFGWAFVTLVTFILIYVATQYLLNRQARGNSDWILIRQVVLFSIILMGLIAIILSLPMSEGMRTNITSLISYVISAVIALSSATFIGNMLAGILLRAINNYKSGDFIEVEEIYGRVSERGLFHTELQTVDRNLITLPNLFLATNPIKVTRSSGTFISAEVSLGYDVSRVKIEKCLIEAAKKAGLKDPFVHVTSLGDFSVVYKIHGLLEDIKRVLTAKSRLYSMLLDVLHEADIEIVSPGFVNQRQVNETIFIAQKMKEKVNKNTKSPEDLIFDKAEQAENIEKRRQRLDEIQPKIKNLKDQLDKAATDEEKFVIEGKIKKLESVKERMTKNIVEEEGKLDAEV